MPSKILLIPILLLLGLTAYATIMIDEDYALWLIGPVILAAAVFIMGPQIDWYWFQKHPPKLDLLEKKLLLKKVRFYPTLPTALKEKLEHRVALFNFSKIYTGMSIPSVPEDVKIMMAISASTLTLGFEDYLLEKYEQVILYQHPFPSPQYPDQLHISEIHEEDGVFLFSIQPLMYGFVNPKQYFNIALYELARVVNQELSTGEIKALKPYSLDDILAISGTNQTDLEKYMGLNEIDLKAVALVQLMEFPNAVKQFSPELFNALCAHLNYNTAWLLAD
jgi:hypothetical protein